MRGRITPPDRPPQGSLSPPGSRPTLRPPGRPVRRSLPDRLRLDRVALPEPSLDISELKSKSVGALNDLAGDLKLDGAEELGKEQLIEAIEQALLDRGEALTTQGVLEILPEGYGFLRSQEWSYIASPDDVYISPSQLKRFELRTGDTVSGEVRSARRGEKYPAMIQVDSINGREPESLRERPKFDELRPRYPERRLDLEIEGDDSSLAMRMVDLIAPIGEGQRGLIVSPPKAGKTTILRQMANALTTNSPEAHLIVLLIDERPEEVTEMKAKVKGEVIASTFDESPQRHVQVADMVLEKAKRLVEHGKDVVILLDSITRLARAYNAVIRKSGKILSGGVDANALQKPKQFFGAARNIQDGGSLTIVATALVETGSRMDEVIFEEFKGTGNMELVLDREISDRRIFPAINLNRSSTRKEELLLSDVELNRVFLLRNFLSDMPSVEALEFLRTRMKMTRSNAEFLEDMTRGV